MVLLIQIQSCEKSSATPESSCFRAKLIGQICGEAIFQILDPAFYDLGEKGWINLDKNYDNEFHSFLTCTDMTYLGQIAAPSVVGLEVSLELMKENTDSNCAVCKATFANAPKKNQHVKFRLEGCK